MWTIQQLWLFWKEKRKITVIRGEKRKRMNRIINYWKIKLHHNWINTKFINIINKTTNGLHGSHSIRQACCIINNFEIQFRCLETSRIQLNTVPIGKEKIRKRYTYSCCFLFWIDAHKNQFISMTKIFL